MLAAVGKGDVKELAGLIRQDPGFNVNQALDGFGCADLHYACGDNRRSPMIPLLLAHPDIDVNLKSKDGWTPFYLLASMDTPPVLVRCSRIPGSK